MFAGTKLQRSRPARQYAWNTPNYSGRTDLTLAWSAATGFIGVVVSFDSRSLSEDAEMFLDAEESFLDGSMDIG